MSDIEKLYEIEQENTPRSKKKKKKNTEIKIRATMILISIAMVTFTVIFVPKAIDKVAASYEENKEQCKSNAYESAYDEAYENAQEDYHIDSEFIFTINSTQEIAKLEVLSVGTVEYVVQEGNDENKYTTAWLEVPGEGTYTVNMMTAEYVVDSERNYVLVRLQRPELETNIVEKEVRKIWFNKKNGNGNTEDGVDLANKQYAEANQKIDTQLRSNAYYYDQAEKSAVSMVKNLIKGFHPEVKNLVVDVEFVD